MKFRYTGMDQEGHSVGGAVEADSPAKAAEEVRAKGYSITGLYAEGPAMTGGDQQANQEAQRIFDTMRIQIAALNMGNLEAAPLFAQFCTAVVSELTKDGHFTREEALSILKSSVGKH